MQRGGRVRKRETTRTFDRPQGMVNRLRHVGDRERVVYDPNENIVNHVD